MTSLYVLPFLISFHSQLKNSDSSLLYNLCRHTQQRERESRVNMKGTKEIIIKTRAFCVCVVEKSFKLFIFTKKERNLGERKSLVDSSFPPSTFSFDIEYSS